MSNFCGVLEDIELIIGMEATFKIATECGGTYICIPKNPQPNNQLVKLIGLENVQKLIKDFGTGDVLVPMGHFRGATAKRVRISKLIKDGMSSNKVARIMGVHNRTVKRIKNKDFSSLPLLDYIEKLECQD